MTFIPNKKPTKPNIPYYEDTNGTLTPNYTTTRKPQAVIAMIAEEMGQMGGIILGVDEGTFPIGNHKRLGFEVRFSLDGSLGKIRIAGLPIRNYSDTKAEKVKSQALLTVHAMLQSARVSQLFSPDAHPLTPYLLVTDDKTVAQMFEEKRLLLLTEGNP